MFNDYALSIYAPSSGIGTGFFPGDALARRVKTKPAIKTIPITIDVIKAAQNVTPLQQVLTSDGSLD